MSHPGLDPDLAVSLEVLEHAFGPLQVLDVHPTPPERRPAPPAPAVASPDPDQPSLFDPGPEPASSTSTADPNSHLPPSRRGRAVLRHAGAPLSPTSSTPSTWRHP